MFIIEHVLHLETTFIRGTGEKFFSPILPLGFQCKPLYNYFTTWKGWPSPAINILPDNLSQLARPAFDQDAQSVKINCSASPKKLLHSIIKKFLIIFFERRYFQYWLIIRQNVILKFGYVSWCNLLCFGSVASRNSQVNINHCTFCATFEWWRINLMQQRVQLTLMTNQRVKKESTRNYFVTHVNRQLITSETFCRESKVYV